MSPLVTVNPLVVVFEPFGGSESFGGSDKVVGMLKKCGSCKVTSRQNLRTSGDNPQVKRAMKLRPLPRLLRKSLLAEDNSSGDSYRIDSCQNDSCRDCDRDWCSY